MKRPYLLINYLVLDTGDYGKGDKVALLLATARCTGKAIDQDDLPTLPTKIVLCLDKERKLKFNIVPMTDTRYYRGLQSTAWVPTLLTYLLALLIRSRSLRLTVGTSFSVINAQPSGKQPTCSGMVNFASCLPVERAFCWANQFQTLAFWEQTSNDILSYP